MFLKITPIHRDWRPMMLRCVYDGTGRESFTMNFHLSVKRSIRYCTLWNSRDCFKWFRENSRDWLVGRLASSTTTTLNHIYLWCQKLTELIEKFWCIHRIVQKHRLAFTHSHTLPSHSLHGTKLFTTVKFTNHLPQWNVGQLNLNVTVRAWETMNFRDVQKLQLPTKISPKFTKWC